MAENEEELKSTLMRVKEKWEKASLKVNIKKKRNSGHGIWSHHCMANRKGKGRYSDRFSWALNCGAGGECSHEIRRCLLHVRKAISNLESILKSKDIILPAKV